VIQGWSVLFPEFRLTPSDQRLPALRARFLTVVPYVASTVASWKAAVTDPEEVMRG
jgi:hypothetical protein